MPVIRRRLSSRGVPDCTDAHATWLVERPSLCSSSGALGVRSLRRFVPASGWTRRVGSAAKRVARATFVSLGISAGPGPRVVCAAFPSPNDFRPGNRSLFEERPTEELAASTSGLRSRLRSASPAFLPKTDPALGFASCRVVGTDACIRSGSTLIASPASGGSTAATRGRDLLSAHGLRANLPKLM